MDCPRNQIPKEKAIAEIRTPRKLLSIIYLEKPEIPPIINKTLTAIPKNLIPFFFPILFFISILI